MLERLRTALTPDLRPLKESRDYRLLMTGAMVTGLGTQASLVAVPYQVYVITHKPVLVGLLGVVELGPLVTASLFGGALATAVAGRFGGKVGVVPRIFLKKLVADVLDRVDQFADFNPRTDYALTVSDAELTAVERAASAGTSIDDIHLEDA